MAEFHSCHGDTASTGCINSVRVDCMDHGWSRSRPSNFQTSSGSRPDIGQPNFANVKFGMICARVSQERSWESMTIAIPWKMRIRDKTNDTDDNVDDETGDNCKNKIESDESSEVVSFTRRVINRISSNSDDSDDEESYASEDFEEMLKEFAIAEEEELNSDCDSLDNILSNTSPGDESQKLRWELVVRELSYSENVRPDNERKKVKKVSHHLEIRKNQQGKPIGRMTFCRHNETINSLALTRNLNLCLEQRSPACDARK
ncbi:hypothetical protein WN51_14297 [Melipona quadrifasciata]|uniref:Uncharacterized protein n=1 Tax=Melipona quadrifasciata TaxID=166423 RepID=A0A0M9A105_9HYME|nr:hypothetical protein WN51_14297 [Melipona quadrifasciata]